MKRAATRSSSSTGRLPSRRIDNIICQQNGGTSSSTTMSTMLLASLVEDELQRYHRQQRRAIHLNPTSLLRGPSPVDSTNHSSLLDEDETPTELLIDGELLGDDELLSTSGMEVTGDADSEGLIGCMDDYESLLEDSILSGGATTSSTSSPGGGAGEEEVAVTYTFTQLTEMVVGLLPADASSVPLTAITPGLDDAMEYICDKYGSLLSFLKLNNSKVVIESKAGGKFFVRRVLSVHRQSELASEAERGQALRRASQRAEAEAETVRQNAPPPKRTGRKVKLQRVEASQPSGVLEREGAVPSPLLSLFLKDVFSGIDADSTDGKVVAVFSASQMLDPATKSAIKERYTTVTKFIRSQTDTLDVSWDCSKIGYPKGTSMHASDLVAPASIQAKYATATSSGIANADDEEFAGDEWAVDLGVGDDGDVAVVTSTTSMEEEDAGDLPVDEDARQFTSSETADRESFYSGVAGGSEGGAAPKKLSTAEIRAIPAAPAAPVDAMSASTLVNVGSDTVGGKVPPLLPGQSPPLSKEMATKMEEAHTQLAVSKGWKTPRAMLDLFVECVPTFYVAISHLTVPQALQEAVGKNTLFKVFKAYLYFFEMKVEDGTHFVKIRDIVDHDKRGGVTDELYAHVKGKKTRTIGHGAFPVLDRFMGRTGSLSDYIQKKKKEWEQKPARLRIPEPPVRRALRRAVGYDSLTSIDEALVARVKQEAYTIKSEERARKMKLAIAITTTSTPEADAASTATTAPSPPPQQDDPAIEAITLEVVVEELMVTRCNDYLFYPPLEVGGSPAIQPTTTTTTPSPLQSSWPPLNSSSLDSAAADRGEWVENKSFTSSGFTAGFGGAISTSDPSTTTPDSTKPQTTTATIPTTAATSQSAVNGRLVRLRPFWTAPHSTAEYTLASSPFGRDTVHPLASHIRSAGLWTHLSKALERVSLSAARKVQDTVLYMNADRFNRPSRDQEPSSFADSLPSRFKATDKYDDVPVTMMSWSAPGETQGGYAKAPQRADRLPYIKGGIVGEESTVAFPDAVDEGGEGQLLALLTPYFPTRLVDLLRLHGGVTWVDCAPKSKTTPSTDESTAAAASSTVRLRKFTGFVDLDDVEHTLVDELRYALVRLQTDHKEKGNVTEFTVDEVCGAVAPTYRGMLTYTEDNDSSGAPPTSPSSSSCEFLSVPLECYGAPMGSTLEVPFQRHPPYHRLLRFLTDHKKFFDVRVEEKKIVATTADEGSLEGAVRQARQEHMRAKERARRKEARAAAGHSPEDAVAASGGAQQQLTLPVSEGDVAQEDDQSPRRVLYISAANIFGRQQHQNLRGHSSTSTTPSSNPQPISQSDAKMAVSKAVKAHEDEPDCSPSAAQFAASATHYMQDLATAAAIVSPAKYKRAGMQPEPKTTPSAHHQPTTATAAATTNTTPKWDPRSAASSSWGGVVGKRR